MFSPGTLLMTTTNPRLRVVIKRSERGCQMNTWEVTMRALSVMVLLMLGACGGDKSYTIDGVPVVLERGVGPEQEALTFATHLYRQGAEDQFQLTLDEELVVWRSIGQIRWTSAPVKDGANYDADLNVLSANWRGCVLSVPFYQALVFVYADDELERHLEWAHELEKSSRDALCLPERRSLLPSF